MSHSNRIHQPTNSHNMSDTEDREASKTEKYEDAEEDDKDEETRAAEDRVAREAARKRCYKYSDPPKVYTDVNVSLTLLISNSYKLH